MSLNKMQTPVKRLMSLDFFRGITVAAMILVNNPGDWGHIYSPLEHSVWNGCTPTDLIFPFFLFIVGVSIAYAIGSKKDDKLQHKRIIVAAARRSVIIYLLFAVMALMRHFDFAHFRIMGVLPRIAIVFFICAVIFLKTSRRTQLILFFLILLVYYLLMAFVAVPGYGPANLEPGTNLAAWLDNVILTEPHMWSGTKTWDPEGILSTIPAISTCLFGTLMGSMLRRKDKLDAEKVSWLFTIAVFAIVAGKIWGTFFPINKALWTSSFVLYTGGLATAALALSYWLIDVQQRKKYIQPFVAFGSNAITAYVAADVVLILLDLVHVNANGHLVSLQQYLFITFFTPYFSPVNASLAGGITYVLILLIPLWLLYKQKKFIKI